MNKNSRICREQQPNNIPYLFVVTNVLAADGTSVDLTVGKDLVGTVRLQVNNLTTISSESTSVTSSMGISDGQSSKVEDGNLLATSLVVLNNPVGQLAAHRRAIRSSAVSGDTLSSSEVLERSNTGSVGRQINGHLDLVSGLDVEAMEVSGVLGVPLGPALDVAVGVQVEARLPDSGVLVALAGAIAVAVDADPDGDGALGVTSGVRGDDNRAFDVGDAAAHVVGAGPVVRVLGRAAGDASAGVVLADGTVARSGSGQGGCEGEGGAVLHGECRFG